MRASSAGFLNVEMKVVASELYDQSQTHNSFLKVKEDVSTAEFWSWSFKQTCKLQCRPFEVNRMSP